MTRIRLLRGAGERALSQRKDAGPRASLHRRGGCRRRRLLGASPRRLDHQSTHRGHGHCLAKGAEIDRMFAELLGKEAGYCRGKGGSMHIADHENGNLGANAIVGGSAGIATGAAFSAKRRGTDQVAVCFFGEGALGQGLALRGHEHGVALDAARDLRLREQPVQRVHALPRGHGRRHPRPAAGVRHRGAGGRRSGRARGLRRRRPSWCTRARRRGAGVPAVQHLPLSTAITSATSTAPTTARRTRRSCGGATARPAARCSARGCARRDSPTTPTSKRDRGRGARRGRGRRRSSRSTRRIPDPSEVTEDVFA